MATLYFFPALQVQITKKVRKCYEKCSQKITAESNLMQHCNLGQINSYKKIKIILPNSTAFRLHVTCETQTFQPDLLRNRGKNLKVNA